VVKIEWMWPHSSSRAFHVAVIITFGGLAADGTWRTPKKNCLLPRKVLMQVYRRNFRRLLLSALDKGELVLPPNMTPTASEKGSGTFCRNGPEGASTALKTFV
jgi:hypothetical protein